MEEHLLLKITHLMTQEALVIRTLHPALLHHNLDQVPPQKPQLVIILQKVGRNWEGNYTQPPLYQTNHELRKT
jgi:hypothetical protein